MAKFLKAVTLVFKNEGGLSEDPDDAGGISNFGVSYRFYKKKVKVDATPENIKNLTAEEASNIYERFFWNRGQYERIDDQKIADRLLDLAVNCGLTTANGFIQKAINAMQRKDVLVVDGYLGPKSFDAINSSKPDMLYNYLLQQANAYYHEIAEHGNNHKYLNGWIRRLNDTC